MTGIVTFGTQFISFVPEIISRLIAGVKSMFDYVKFFCCCIIASCYVI